MEPVVQRTAARDDACGAIAALAPPIEAAEGYQDAVQHALTLEPSRERRQALRDLTAPLRISLRATDE